MRNNRMPKAGKALLIGVSLAVAGCAADSVGTAGARTAFAESTPAAGQAQPGAIRTGAQTSGMAAQYSGRRAGRAVGTGASAWVPPAPAPAFVITQLPPAAPPPLPPAAVQNRQSGSAPSPAADASQIVGPEAAAPQSPAPAATPAPSATTREAGRRLFANYSCGTCHTFADAGAAGAIGPSLDNPGLTRDIMIDVIKTGRGAMPSFGGQMSDQEIATLADYIVGARSR